MSYLFRKIILIFCFVPTIALANNDTLISQLKTIAQDAKGKVSVSALVIEDSLAVSYYGDEPCVMQSVFKFPISIVILNKIDNGEFSLLHKIHITPKEMIKNTWSPMRDSFPNGNVNITFQDLIQYAVGQSDNIACDVLLDFLGKPKVVQKYFQKLGIDDFKIKYSEQGMHKNWKNQYKNTCSPNAMISILKNFYQQKYLSEKSTNFLYSIMEKTPTGKNRIVKLLPNGTQVAHKTGTSDMKNGMTAATNDVGIITLPNGKHLALAIFVNDAFADNNTIELVIARIAKTIYDEYAK